MKRTFDLGKIDWFNTGKKINLVEITMELIDTYQGPVLTINPTVWNQTKTQMVKGVVDMYNLEQHFTNESLFEGIFELWFKYHMNNAHNGTIKQEKCLREHQDELKEFEHLGWLNDRQELLKKYNLLIDDGFKYASQLLYHPIEKNDLIVINQLLKST